MSERDNFNAAPVPTKTFYGRQKLKDSLRLEKLQNEEKAVLLETYPYKLLNVNSPTTTWKIFRKQIQALEFAKERKNGVMTFVFQHGLSGERLFLVAHPLMFWHYDSMRNENRCSYEVIPEGCACKLYFDLEFSKELNPLHDGGKMTDVFIELVCSYIKKTFGIMVKREHVLDMDSTTEFKFSRHLIFQLPHAVFKDNYSVGNFVKMICKDLALKKDSNSFNLNVSCLNVDDISKLFILNSKGESRLFCDEGVYTKNRHFRLYHSSKWKRNAPLILSKENTFHPSSSELNIANMDEDTIVFLHSLITYLGNDVDSLKVLEFGESGIQTPVNTHSTRSFNEKCDGSSSPYPYIDMFIKQLVAPGKIYRWFYFASGNCVVYNIVGYRYCNNIGREHRSNNIKYVVSLNEKCYYQKCYDPECSGYRSKAFKLPGDLSLMLESGTVENVDSELPETLLGYFGLPEDEFVDFLDIVENEERSVVGDTSTNVSLDEFPDYGLPDSSLLNALASIDHSV
ncbi:DNA-directed primase/polymerase protein [Anabrus simplex]|uniref:DNA-directed primase/polymerase protein n=1 Tax=Anabrus simplex TaxID=316456 RepID=UPI0035A26533